MTGNGQHDSSHHGHELEDEIARLRGGSYRSQSSLQAFANEGVRSGVEETQRVAVQGIISHYDLPSRRILSASRISQASKEQERVLSIALADALKTEINENKQSEREHKIDTWIAENIGTLFLTIPDCISDLSVAPCVTYFDMVSCVCQAQKWQTAWTLLMEKQATILTHLIVLAEDIRHERDSGGRQATMAKSLSMACGSCDQTVRRGGPRRLLQQRPSQQQSQWRGLHFKCQRFRLSSVYRQQESVMSCWNST